MQSIIAILFALFSGYLVVGLLFTMIFLRKGLSTVDPGAKDKGIRFMILLATGLMAFWPIFLRQWIKARTV